MKPTGTFSQHVRLLDRTIAGLEAENARLLARVEEAETKARYCTQCRSNGVDEAPLGREVYICFWCGDGFCHDHAVKHFGAEHSGRSDLTRDRDEYKALAERCKKALKPFAEVYGRSSKLIHETRGMSSVPLRHRVVLLSEQSDGSFGYLSIRTFRNARAAILKEEK